MTLPRIRPITRASVDTAVAVLGVCSRQAAIAELEEDDKARDIRRIERQERRGGSNDRWLRCHGCRRRLRAANEHCHCGFNNDIRGRRNHGSYR